MSQQAPQRNDDQNILAITVLFGLVIVLLFLVFMNQPVPQAAPTPTPQPTEVALVVEPTPEATPEAIVEQPVEGQPASYTQQQVADGQRVFGGLCFACHGQGGVGITGLGKPLVNSEYVSSLTDDELLQMIIVGRQPTDPLNTTGQLMPARGGNPSLSDGDLLNVVAYIRSLNGAPVGDAAAPAEGAASAPTPSAEVRRPTAAEDWVAPPINALDASVVAAGIQNTGQIDPIAGEDGAALYAWYCQSCHGLAGAGVDGAAALVGMGMDFEAFASALTTPAPLTAPASNVFVHPLRGGSPGMNDAQIAALISYLQGLDG